MTIDTTLWAPVLDLLEGHHENLGHAGPAKHCALPECQDVLTLLEENSPAECCPYCDGLGEPLPS